MYFLRGTTIVSYDTADGKWGSIDASATAAMTDGPALAAVEGTGGADSFLVVSGGGTKQVMSYNVKTATWKAEKPTLHSVSNTCAIGCYGRWVTMTGDFKKSDAVGVGGNVSVGKPSNRQIYSYNLTDGTVFQNNGDKQRGGAGCACAALSPTVGEMWFGGGESDAGISDAIDLWRTPLARGGEPKLGMATKAREVGGGSCGGFVFFAGGDSGKTLVNEVTVYPANVSTPALQRKTVLALAHGARYPKIGCVGGRYALISGGVPCTKDVYVIDTQKPLGSSATSSFQLAASGAVAVASTARGSTAGFFDGATLDLFSA